MKLGLYVNFSWAIFNVKTITSNFYEFPGDTVVRVGRPKSENNSGKFG